MTQVAANADLYAETRQNTFFPGVVPSLDGQCVSLVKWFMQEMSEVPNPQAARGDARYVGQTLVAQGHAVEVPYADRKRGDVICYEYGVYGHIAVQLSGGRVFEENVNIGGVDSKIVDGARVYASRIGNENEVFRRDVHVYRLKTYKEGDKKMMTEDGVRFGILGVTGGKPMDTYETEVKYWTNRDPAEFCKYLYGLGDYYMVAARAEIVDLKKQLANAGAEYVETTVYTKKAK